MIKKSLGLLFVILCLVSCGYRLGHGELSERYSTISVPYVEGDLEGKLTAQVIEQLGTSGVFTYKKEGADLTLKAKILDYHDENIGFQYARDNQGNRVDKVLPNEGRIRALVEVTLMENTSGKVLMGPKRLAAMVDYDFDPDLSQNNVTSFSLGQFNAVDAAKDVAMQPLGKSLAESIIDYVTNSW